MNIEKLNYGRLEVICWGVGGSDRIRPLYRHFYQEVNGFIFVVDSNDRERMDEVEEQLHKIINEEELKNVSLLILANKQDLPNALSQNDIVELLGLKKLKRKWMIGSICATESEGDIAQIFKEFSQTVEENCDIFDDLEFKMALGNKKMLNYVKKIVKEKGIEYKGKKNKIK